MVDRALSGNALKLERSRYMRRTAWRTETLPRRNRRVALTVPGTPPGERFRRPSKRRHMGSSAMWFSICDRVRPAQQRRAMDPSVVRHAKFNPPREPSATRITGGSFWTAALVLGSALNVCVESPRPYQGGIFSNAGRSALMSSIRSIGESATSPQPQSRDR